MFATDKLRQNTTSNIPQGTPTNLKFSSILRASRKALNAKKNLLCYPDNKARPGKADRRAEGTNPGLPLHCLTAAVKLRVAQPDCFAGTVFRVEPSSYCPSIADGAVSIARGLSNEDIMVVIVKVRLQL